MRLHTYPSISRAAAAALVITSFVVCARSAAAAPVTVAAKGDAAVVHDATSESWTIGAAGISLTLGIDADNALVVRRGIIPQTDRTLDTPAPDTFITINGQTIALTEAATGLRFEDAHADETAQGVHLRFTYTHREWHATIARHYAAYPRSPIVETWTTIQMQDGAEPLAVSGLVGWHASVPVGAVRWVNGLRGDAPDNPVDDAFSIDARSLAPGETLTLGADRRSSERFLPFATIDAGAGRWFVGVQWSGRWQIDCTRKAASIDVTASIPDTTTSVTVDHPLEIPHSFIGFSTGGSIDVGRALRAFLMAGVRGGRPIQPLVTFNTWYQYGTRINEPTLLDEIDRTAALGVELFVVDAGWYNGAGSHGYYDFETGLGTWTPDPGRFPTGLRPLADRAHARGMKFGVWVEPGRVSLDTVGQEGLVLDEWLAQDDGVNASATSGTICFANRAGRDWVRAKLFALIDEVQPDYLKWDDNAWVNCNRAGHDHGPEDGNLRQVQGLYSVLDELRERYPDLIIENVAGGGSRLDFEMLRHTDVAWVDDRTSPAIRVRHNLQGVSGLFPPGDLLSFVLDSATRPLADSSDPLAEIRSSMMGALGFGYKSADLRGWLADAFRDTIRAYAMFRDILQGADAMLLSDQAPSLDNAGWDVVETLNGTTLDAVLFVFHQPDANDRVTVVPRGLDPSATYSVTSMDAGDLGTAPGSALMADGVEVVQGTGTQAHVLVVRRLQ